MPRRTRPRLAYCIADKQYHRINPLGAQRWTIEDCGAGFPVKWIYRFPPSQDVPESWLHVYEDIETANRLDVNGVLFCEAISPIEAAREFAERGLNPPLGLRPEWDAVLRERAGLRLGGPRPPAPCELIDNDGWRNRDYAFCKQEGKHIWINRPSGKIWTLDGAKGLRIYWCPKEEAWLIVYPNGDPEIRAELLVKRISPDEAEESFHYYDVETPSELTYLYAEDQKRLYEQAAALAGMSEEELARHEEQGLRQLESKLYPTDPKAKAKAIAIQEQLEFLPPLHQAPTNECKHVAPDTRGRSRSLHSGSTPIPMPAAAVGELSQVPPLAQAELTSEATATPAPMPMPSAARNTEESGRPEVEKFPGHPVEVTNSAPIPVDMPGLNSVLDRQAEVLDRLADVLDRKRRGAPSDRNPERDAWIIKRRNAGKTYAEIADELLEKCVSKDWSPVTAQAIHQICLRHQIKS